ncbi:hypothetical protein [Vallitalea guaymasensis]|uniref:hypothetical protein n=1 Tax=Vallitalea guaymasensis TaxID=1185412 RepID=UPI000DE3DBE8|nr:hypothetical protein [Vallitalea guaymasensis]
MDQKMRKAYIDYVTKYYFYIVKCKKGLLCLKDIPEADYNKGQAKIKCYFDSYLAAYKSLEVIKNNFQYRIADFENYKTKENTFEIRNGILIGDEKAALILADRLIDSYNKNPLKSQETSNNYELGIYIKSILTYLGANNIIYGPNHKQLDNSNHEVKDNSNKKEENTSAKDYDSGDEVFDETDFFTITSKPLNTKKFSFINSII